MEEAQATEHKDYVTIYRALIGWKAVWVTWNPELGGFWEPEDTGIGAYRNPADAEIEAKQWAVEMGLEYVPCKAASN
jgi:catalase (peroxidase I)